MGPFWSYVKIHSGPLLAVAIAASNFGLVPKGLGLIASAIAAACGVPLP